MVMKHRWIALLAGALLAAPVQARLPEGSYAMAATQSRVSASVSFFSVSQKKVGLSHADRCRPLSRRRGGRV
jgi:hypothetical protein